jgi:phage shock protein A
MQHPMVTGMHLQEMKPSKFAKVREQIEIWRNRASIARELGKDELADLSLVRTRDYENELARLQEFEDET